MNNFFCTNDNINLTLALLTYRNFFTRKVFSFFLNLYVDIAIIYIKKLY